MGEHDPLPPPDPNTPPRGGKIVCEFCESQLAQSGDVLKLGNKAREYRDAEREHERQEQAIADRDATIADLRQQIETLKAAKPADAPAPAKRGWLSGS